MIRREHVAQFICADGTNKDTLRDAQAHDLDALLGKRTGASEGQCYPWAEYLVEHSAEVLDILITDGRKRKRLKKSPAKPRKKSAHDSASAAPDEAALTTKTSLMP